MTDATADSVEKPTKPKKMSMILMIILALAGAGAGYFIVYSGLISTTKPETGHAENEQPAELPDIAFVEIDPIMISLNSGQVDRHLRFRAQLEVNADHRRDVELILPRVVDVLNGYLRALELGDLRDPLALTKLRAQMLRRVQIVAGKGRVRDLLIMEFVLN